MNFKDFYFQTIIESDELIKQLKNVNAKDLYRVAADIRQHFSDYDDLNLLDLAEFLKKPEHLRYSATMRIDKNNPKNNIVYMIFNSDTLDYKNQRLNELRHYNNSYMELSEYDDEIEDLEFRIKNHSDAQIVKIPTEQYKKLRNDYVSIQSYLESLPKKTFEKRHKLDNSDINYLINKFEITTPDIYNFLVFLVHNKPKHPNELPSEYLGAPNYFLEQLADGKSIVDITTETSRSTIGVTKGTCQILNIDKSEYSPTKQEAKEYFQYVIKTHQAAIQKITKTNLEPNTLSFRISSKSSRSRINLPTNILNFPSYLIKKYLAESYYISFQTFKTFRWFVHNIKSTYFYKEKTIHGPANQTNSFVPLEHIVQIIDDDLDNGIKTSPEKAFNNASTRKAREFENNNKDSQFKYDKEYTDTDKVKVIRNSKALEYEGKRMDHCVGGYSASCLSKRSLILHLPHSTAELNPQTLQIYQHRGRSNSSPSEEDVSLLNDWIKQNQS